MKKDEIQIDSLTREDMTPIGKSAMFGFAGVVENVDWIVCSTWNEFENAAAALKLAGVPFTKLEDETGDEYCVIRLGSNISPKELNYHLNRIL